MRRFMAAYACHVPNLRNTMKSLLDLAEVLGLVRVFTE